MLPLENDVQVGWTVLISAAVPVLVTGLITLIKRLVDIMAARKRDKADTGKVEAETGKLDAEATSTEADVFTKTLTGQGSVMDRLLMENTRAYQRADDAEAAAAQSKKVAEEAKEEARLAREEVADLKEAMLRDHEQRRLFEDQIEGYLIQHKIGLPPWWKRHGAPVEGGGAQA